MSDKFSIDSHKMSLHPLHLFRLKNPQEHDNFI